MKFIPKKATQTVARQVLKAKKNSPHIFFAAGVVGVVGSTFLACRATLKLEETLDEITDEIREVKTPAGTNYSESDHYKDLGYVYGKSAVKLGRLYGPSVALGAVSIGALAGSHIQLTRRNTALTAAFAGLSKAFDDYRVRIAQEIGEEREMDIYRGVNDEEVTTDGKTETVKVKNENGHSIYARLFEESNNNWVNNAEMNHVFIKCQQNWANDRLQARGYIFLNDVYEALGMERSHAGQIVGWTLDSEGDGYVDFGLHEAHAEDFLRGYEKNIWLDFNVDGMIHEKF